VTTSDLVEIVDAFFKGDNDARMTLADVLEEAGKDGSAAFLRYGDVIACMKRAEAACLLYDRIWQEIPFSLIDQIGPALAHLMAFLIDGRTYKVRPDDQLLRVVKDLFPEHDNLVWKYIEVRDGRTTTDHPDAKPA
jgi:hypothetical protein